MREKDVLPLRFEWWRKCYLLIYISGVENMLSRLTVTPSLTHLEEKILPFLSVRGCVQTSCPIETQKKKKRFNSIQRRIRRNMESILCTWQVVSLAGLALWIVVSSFFNFTQKVRSVIQPWITHYVIRDTPFILQIQGLQHGFLDKFFSALSCVVSVPFYTAFLPLLFWSGHTRLARQMTLLMTFCDYLGNCIKDLVSAPRPSSPPVRRVTATEDEKENALEYGLPSSHTLNTVCLSGYLFCYVLNYTQHKDGASVLAGFVVGCLLVGLIALGRIYLGMHSMIDVIGGFVLGLVILTFWLMVHEYVDSFIISEQNVVPFWVALSILQLFAYPRPELPTPSFEFHTAFSGVALGIVSGVQQTYHQFHHEDVPRIFSQQHLTPQVFVGRTIVGIPTILLVKFCSKVLAKWILPVVSNTLSIPIKSTAYVPSLNGSTNYKKSYNSKQSSYLQKLFAFSKESFDVDTGIRFLQYAGLAWSVVDLVPSIFSHIGL